MHGFLYWHKVLRKASQDCGFCSTKGGYALPDARRDAARAAVATLVWRVGQRRIQRLQARQLSRTVCGVRAGAGAAAE